MFATLLREIAEALKYNFSSYLFHFFPSPCSLRFPILTDFCVFHVYWFSIFMSDEIQICHAYSNLPSVFIKEHFYQYTFPAMELFQKRKCGIEPTLLRSATDICSFFIFHILLYLYQSCFFPQCFCIFF